MNAKNQSLHMQQYSFVQPWVLHAYVQFCDSDNSIFGSFQFQCTVLRPCRYGIVQGDMFGYRL